MSQNSYIALAEDDLRKSQKKSWRAALVSVCTLAILCSYVVSIRTEKQTSNISTTPPLPALKIDPDGISMSGISSGADFTGQFMVAFSSILKGCGLFAGQAWQCAIMRFPHDQLVPLREDTSVPRCLGCPPNKTLIYDHCKNHPQVVIPEMLANAAKDAAKKGDIDPVENLRNSRIYLYRGTKDDCYFNGSMVKVKDFFSLFVKNATEQVMLVNTIKSDHAWPSKDFGVKCGHLYGLSDIESCNYDGPGAALHHIYGKLREPANTTLYPEDNLHLFDQGPYKSGTGLNHSGYIYIPTDCKKPIFKCKLHVVLHGCGVNHNYDNYAHHLFNAHAELNNIVILYPRMALHGSYINEKAGCWDSYGQTGYDYATKSGLQMKAVRAMIAAVANI